jgi:hypothetical protein
MWKIPNTKQGWWSGSSGRVPATTLFKPQYCRKTKQNKKTTKNQKEVYLAEKRLPAAEKSLEIAEQARR